MYPLITLPKIKHYDGQDVRIVQNKLNGHYIQVYRGHSDDIQIFTKKQEENIWPKLSKCSLLSKEILSLPCDTAFEAELYAEDIYATSVPTLLNDGDDRLLIAPFCLHQFAGKSCKEAEIDCINLLGVGKSRIKPAPFSFLAGAPRSLSEEEIVELLHKAQAKHLEGWVLKTAHHGYWYKLKPTKTVDCIVVGFTKSTSDTKYGALKAVQVAVRDDHKLKEIASVGTGFDDDFRRAVKPETLIGKVLEVEYDCVAADGRLNFPRAAKNEDGTIKWRTDKTPNQCTIDQLEDR